VDVKRTQTYGVAPAEMWERIGDFHGLHLWHPHVAETEVREENVRALTLENGGKTVETKIDEGDLHHSYRIDESDLPVKNFEATLLVRESGEGADGSEIVWTAQFDAHGAEDADAAEIVEGVFEAGLRSLHDAA
jgi:mxaD protein